MPLYLHLLLLGPGGVLLPLSLLIEPILLALPLLPLEAALPLSLALPFGLGLGLRGGGSFGLGRSPPFLFLLAPMSAVTVVVVVVATMTVTVASIPPPIPPMAIVHRGAQASSGRGRRPIRCLLR